MSTTQAPTYVARLMTDAATAARVFEALSATIHADAVAVSLFEETDGRASVGLHFRELPDEAAIRDLVSATAGAEAGAALKLEKLTELDWVRQGLAALTPIEAGRFTVHGAHDRGHICANRIAIQIEAGLAFGTGHHGTTRGCLIALDGIVKRETAPSKPAPKFKLHKVPREPARSGSRRTRSHILQQRKASRAAAVLDIGTGTGVLAIAAAKALRRAVLASDIDARAATVARANARLNRAAGLIEVIRADGVGRMRFGQRGPYQLIFANILLAPLQRLATPIGRLISARGEVVLSGLLAGQEVAALASYRARGFVFVQRIRLNGWTTLVLRRP